MVARSGTLTCSRVPSGLISCGLIETTRVLPPASRVLNSTEVPVLKLLPRSSITSPTLAEACAALAGVPSRATPITWLKPAVAVAAQSRFGSTW